MHACAIMSVCLCMCMQVHNYVHVCVCMFVSIVIITNIFLGITTVIKLKYKLEIAHALPKQECASTATV